MVFYCNADHFNLFHQTIPFFFWPPSRSPRRCAICLWSAAAKQSAHHFSYEIYCSHIWLVRFVQVACGSWARMWSRAIASRQRRVVNDVLLDFQRMVGSISEGVGPAETVKIEYVSLLMAQLCVRACGRSDRLLLGSSSCKLSCCSSCLHLAGWAPEGAMS